MSQRNIQTQQQVQSQQQVQQQTLSAQQVIAVRLTEMSLDALRQRVENECLENPWLEHNAVFRSLPHGVMVAPQILNLLVKVRILVRQPLGVP